MDLTGRTVRKGWGALERDRHYLCRTPTGGIQSVEVHSHDRVLVQRRLRSLGVDRVLRRSRENVAVSTEQPLLPPAASPSNMKPDNAQSGHHSPTTCLNLRPLGTGSSCSSVPQQSSKSFIGNSSQGALPPGNCPSVPGASDPKCEIWWDALHLVQRSTEAGLWSCIAVRRADLLPFAWEGASRRQPLAD